MKRLAFVWCALFFIAATSNSQECATGTRFFVGDGGWVEYRHTVALPPRTSNLFRRSLVGDFTFGANVYLVAAPTWSLAASINIQNIFGGFVKRRAKVYATDYRITIGGHITVGDGYRLSIATVHKSTHLADDFVIETTQDKLDLLAMRLDTDDKNILRIGIGKRTEESEWDIGIQPLSMRFFVIAEPRYVFNSRSYVPYENRVYARGVTTIWKNDAMRVSLSGEGEFEANFEYLASLRWSMHLGRTPSSDGLELSFENSGGIGKNRIKTTTFNGLGTNRWALGIRVTI